MANNPAVTAPATWNPRPREETLDDRITNGNNNIATGDSGTVNGNHNILKTVRTSDPSGEESELQNTKTSASRSTVKNERGWRRIVRNFSPSWFSSVMGTGVVGIILHSIPWKADWLYYLSIVFFALTACLFCAAFTISLLRYTIWPEIWSVMLQDATNSLFLGTAPMAFATLVEMWIFVCVPAWGSWAAYVGWALWMIDSVAAIAVTVSLGVLLMSESHQHSLGTITAAQLLPIAATIVAAGTGSDMAAALPNPQHALATAIASYVMWGMAVPMAFSVLVIYYQRLALHKMPPREVIVSAFLPLGPLGLGGRAIVNLGLVCKNTFPQTHSINPMAGQIAYVVGFFIALVMWGWGLIWFAFALASIYKSRPIPFNMGWWGFTFPLGVYSASTIFIGEQLQSLFFRVLGTIFGVSVILLWIVIASRTAHGAWNGHLFNAPCLAKLKKEQPEGSPTDGSEREKQSESWTSSRHQDEGLYRTATDIESG